MSDDLSDDIEARLKTRDAGMLTALLLKRAGLDNDFRLWLATELAALDARQLQTPLDPEPFRRRAAALLETTRSSTYRRPWGEPTFDIDEAALEELIDQAQPFLAAGNGNNVLEILKPVARSLVEYWPQCAEWDETLHEFFPQLDRMIATAVLLDGISHEMRDDLADELSQWQDEVAQYGADGAFAVAIAAATHGWDEPGLESTLNGRGRTWPLTGTSAWLEDPLTTARLDALEAMGRTEQFLNFSRAAGRYCDHAMMLAKRGQFDQAITVAHTHLRDPNSILRLAESLQNMDQLDAAFELASWGLSLPLEKDASGVGCQYGRHALACWLRETAHVANRTALSVMAAGAAFEQSFSREDYRTAEKLCPAQEWPAVRTTLLSRLLDAAYARDRIDILLDEKRIDDAVATVDRKDGHFHSPHDDALMRLALAACALHPDWAIRLAVRMANPIMVEGRSSHYDLAARWLAIAARAHSVAGTTGEWRTRLDALIETHRRKRNLRPLLEALRPSG